MKKIIILLVVAIIPTLSYSRIGYFYKNISFLYGGYFNSQSIFSNSFEFNYENARKSCTTRPLYYGLGVSYSANRELNELGLKAIINPTRIRLNFSRNVLFFPYVFIQANLKDQKKEANSVRDFNYRLGIGINGIFYSRRTIQIRTSFQLGYTLSDLYEYANNGMVLELKIGVGLNLKKIRNRKKDEG